MSSGVAEYRSQADAVGEAFEQKFKRFSRFLNEDKVVPASFEGVTLKEAEAFLRELENLRTELTGRKSELSTLKKVIGRLPAEERSGFAQHLGVIEIGLTS